MDDFESLFVFIYHFDFLFADPTWLPQKLNQDSHVTWFVKVKFWQVKFFYSCTSSDTQKGKKKSPGSATVTSCRQSLTPRGEKETQRNLRKTNERKAHRLARSFPMEVMAMLKGVKNTRTKDMARANSEYTDQIPQNVKDSSLEMSNIVFFENI